MSGMMTGAYLGLSAALGVITVVRRVPAFRRPTLDDRLAPYLRDSSARSRLLDNQSTLTPFPTLERLVGPIIKDAAQLVERALGGASSLRRQLMQAGSGTSLEEFRAQQVVWGGIGFACTLAGLLLSIAAGRPINPIAAMAACATGAVIGILARDYWLGREVARREQRMVQEFPTIAELLR